MNEYITFRNHPGMILEKMWKALVFFAVILVGNADDLLDAAELIRKGSIREGIMALAVFILLLAVIVIWNVIRWYKTIITIKDGTIEVAKKTLNRHINTLSVQNISNINLEQNIFHMIIGTCKLKIDTSSLSTANSTDVEIVLKKERAGEVKNLIMQMMSEDAEPNRSVKEFSEDSYDIKYSTKEIIISCIFRTNILLFITAIALLISIIPSIYATDDVVSMVIAVFMQLFAGGSLAVYIVKSWLDDFDFRTKRMDDKILVSHGLIRKRKFTIPVNTINAISIEYTMLGRIFGRASVKAINIGGEGEDAGGVQIMLAKKWGEISSDLKMLLPEYPVLDMDNIKRQPARVFWYKLLRSFAGLLCLIPVRYLICNMFSDALYGNAVLIALVPAYILLSVLFNILSYYTNGLYTGYDYLVISSGMLARKIIMMPYDKIQYITEKSGPVEAMMNIRHAKVSILANAANSKNPVKSFSVDEFYRIHQRLKDTY